MKLKRSRRSGKGEPPDTSGSSASIEAELLSALMSQHPDERRVAIGHLLVLLKRELKPLLDEEEREHDEAARVPAGKIC